MSLQVLDRDTFSIVSEYKQSMEDVDNHFMNYEEVMKDIEIKNYCKQYWDSPILQEDYFKIMTRPKQRRKYKEKSLKELRDEFEDKLEERKVYLKKTKRALRLRRKRRKQKEILKGEMIYVVIILLIVFFLHTCYRELPLWFFLTLPFIFGSKIYTELRGVR